MRHKYSFKPSTDDHSVAYLKIEYDTANSARVVNQAVSLQSVLEGVLGPTVYFDIASDGRLLGIELVGEDENTARMQATKYGR